MSKDSNAVDYKRMLLNRAKARKQEIDDGPDDKPLDHVQYRNKKALKRWQMAIVKAR